MSLTKKQKQVLDYITQYLNEFGYSPTQMEIKEHFGFKSLGSVQDYIKYLKSSGYLQNEANSVRGLIPVANDANQEEVFQIPLLGKVAAGNPIEAIEGHDTINVPKNMVRKGDYFALTVSGLSMIEDGILDGDTIIVKKQNHASNGDTVIALKNNEATVKRFHKKANLIELHPANSSMKPILVDPSDQFEIKGILAGLIRVY
jgi:repressor LexA